MKNCYNVGVDVGGTNTHVALVDPQGRISQRSRFDSHMPLDQLVASIAEAVAKMQSDGNEIGGIGVGVPCANTRTGCVEGATELPWPNPTPLAKMISDATGLPCRIANDANAAAAGEHAYGAARGLDNFILLTLGTGVGAGVYCDGHLLNGRNGFAAELGHVVVDPEGPQCGCGRRGCLQMYCSAQGVKLIASQLLAKSNAESSLRQLPLDQLTPLAIAQAAAKGDALAIETYRRVGERLGSACANFAAFTDPEAFVFFGGVAKAFPLFKETMLAAYRRDALFLYRDNVSFLPSSLPDADPALLGAAAIAPAHHQ